MSGTVCGRLRHLGLAAAVLLAALALAAPMAFAKPSTSTGPADLSGAPADEPGLAVSSLSSPPVDAEAGESYELEGTVTNQSASELSGTVTVRLLDSGSAPQTVGTVGVRAAAGSTSSYKTTVAMPAGLPDGSYSLAACTPEGEGLLNCASARRGVLIGEGADVAPTSAHQAPTGDPGVCSSGAHTLSEAGDHVYPETGNGGYTSLHTGVNLIYDATKNRFLPGTNVVLDDLATQCLTDFSLDFERKAPNSEEGPGPNMQVDGVTVNGAPATFEFVQPTYPGDPAGQDDPNPLAHEAGLDAQVGGADPLPPACSPNSAKQTNAEGAAGVGQQCPANKLVITPTAPIAAGESFQVEVEYSGRPGVHTDSDGSSEGWFRSDEPAGDGSFVTTEPVGTEAWMPLNDHPSAKPTYDFDETVTLGRTAIANGELVGFTSNPPDATFPAGSTTWRWHSPEPIAGYLVESSVGSYDLSERLGADGILFYEAQASALTGERKIENKAIMDTQEEIVTFQERFAGPFPFTTDGVVIGATEASFEEEMQGKITFVGGEIDPVTFNHENFHQWFGDNVSESNYDETFYKEGLAQLSEYLLAAKEAAIAAGGLETPAGEAAFEVSLAGQFDENYAEAGKFWTRAPSNPTAATLFSGSSTYVRPGTTYIALRRILGADNFAGALRQLGEEFGGGSVEKSQLEELFKGWLPNQSDACRTRLGTFFTEWFDTAYPAGGAPTDKPQLTGPGLATSAAGTTFYDTTGSCRQTAPTTTASLAPDPVRGLYADPTVTLTATPADGGAPVTGTTYSLDGGAPVAYGDPFVITGTGEHTLTYFSTDADGGVERSHVMQIAVDDPPVTKAQVLPAPVDGQVVGPATVALSATDDSSGIAVTEYGLDGGPLRAYTGPITVGTLGAHKLAYRSVDGDGAVETTKELTFTVAAAPSVCSSPRLRVRVHHPFHRRHGVAILRRGQAYRYTGRLLCGQNRQPAPKGTVVGVSTMNKGRRSNRSSVVVGKGGKIDALLRYSGRRTVVFVFADDTGSARSKVRIATTHRR